MVQQGFLSGNLLKKSSIVCPLRCDSTVLVSGLVTYCMMSVLFNWSEVIFKTWWRSRPAAYRARFMPPLTRLPRPHPNTPGSFFPPALPEVSSSSGYGSFYSWSTPGQDDCMRPVRRLPVSDLPWWGSRERVKGGWGGDSRPNGIKLRAFLRV